MSLGTNGEFADAVALVTGGGSGIGRATALAFARRGARVLVADRNADGAAGTVAIVVAAGGRADAAQVDVTSSAAVEAMVDEAVRRFGGLRYAVNNAGVGGAEARTPEYPEAAWHDVIAVNLTGVWLSMKHEIPAMLAGGGGAIVNVSSVAGLVGFPYHAAYAASKHGVIGLTRTAALEYARKGIRVNAVCPSFTRTPMVEAMVAGDPERERRLEEGVPLGRMGAPEEIAESIVYLCSAAAGFVTGHALTLDGGATAR